MSTLFHPLLKIIDNSNNQSLGDQIEYLKAEVRILRAKLSKRIDFTPGERAKLVKYGKLGSAMKELTGIVHAQTLASWIREKKVGIGGIAAQEGRGDEHGRAAEDRRRNSRLIIKLVKETNWGYTRILGELKKLGVGTVSRQTVKNMLKANGLNPVQTAARVVGTSSPRFKPRRCTTASFCSPAFLQSPKHCAGKPPRWRTGTTSTDGTCLWMARHRTRSTSIAMPRMSGRDSSLGKSGRVVHRVRNRKSPVNGEPGVRLTLDVTY